MDFSRTRLSASRPITSYSKLRPLLSAIMRSRPFPVADATKRAYLNIGCGANVHPDFLNIDYQWAPGVICWDITRGVPAQTASIRGVFLEHCLEHLTLEKAFALLQELVRMLGPEGIARIVVPDGELYLDTYRRYAEGARFPYEEQDGFRGRYTPMMSVNRIFYVQRDEPFGHNFIYDFDTLAMMLRDAGFRDVHRRSFREGADPRLFLDSDWREIESLYVEAMR